MDSSSDDEITPTKDVKKLVIIAGSTLSHVVKKHVKKKKSYATSETGEKLFSLA